VPRVISVYRVKLEAGDAILASAVLYRALRADVEFRFVSVAEGAVVVNASAAHSSLYEVIHEDGAPDGSAGVTLIEPFEVAPDADEGFMAAWHGRRDTFSTQRGYLGTRLHRSLDAAADLRFVELARWSSPLMFFRVSRQAVAALPFRSHPALYVVDDSTGLT
jgi:hypothetical protein